MRNYGTFEKANSVVKGKVIDTDYRRVGLVEERIRQEILLFKYFLRRWRRELLNF